MSMKAALKIALSFALLQVPMTAHANANCASTVQRLQKDEGLCPKNPPAEIDEILSIGSGQNQGSSQLAGQCASLIETAKGKLQDCQKAMKECKAACTTNPRQDCKNINSNIAKLNDAISSGGQCIADSSLTGDQTTANNAEEQSTAPDTASTGGGSGSGGGLLSGSMMPALLGAAAGGLAAWMLMKKDKKDDEDADSDSALLPNGQIDCSKDDAYRYAPCDSNLEATCKAAPDTPNCVNFQARYCGGNIANPPAVIAPSGGIEGAVGAGVGTAFCKFSLAHNFCKTSGRELCPSCAQLATTKSPACQANPALCLAQNSPDQINQAKNTCPTDPLFSDPAWANGGGSQVPPSVAGTNPPAVILPQSVGGSVDGAVREGGSGQEVILPAASGYQTQSAGFGDRLAGSGATGGAARRAVSSTRPASDVEGKYGPSLFAVSTNVIKAHCLAHRYPTCP